MQIASVQKLTLLDFPGRTACTVFTPGCDFRCGYCYNLELVLPELIEKNKKSFISEGKFFEFLKKRKGLLDGVCVTGGEPLLQKDLPEFLQKVRELDFLTKLDTNGNQPEGLSKLLDKKLLDYIALDVKASLERYEKLVGSARAAEKVQTSRDLIMQSEVEYEFRTTLVRELHDAEEFKKILEFVKGAEKFFLQNFQAKHGCLDPEFEKYHGFSKKELEEMCKQAREFVGECGVRG
ncbi:MAG: anaerobic ribonucleoside-triphosphate reductase activating protein [Patescibacteria group bacterium]